MATRAVLLAMMLCAVPASADDRSVAREHYIKGTKAFDLGSFDEAIREYSEAYRVIDDPALLYNIAQAHRLAGHKADALHFYKIYLSKGTRANRDEVQSKIAELQKAIDADRKAQSMPPIESIGPEQKPAPTPTPTSVEPAPAPETAPVAPTPPPPASDASRARTFKIAGAVLIGVGLAVAVGGIAATVLGSNAASDLSNANTNHLPYDPGKYSASQNDPIIGGVLIGVGAAAAVAGAAVLVLGVKRARASAMRLSPQLGPRVAGLRAEVVF